MALLKPAELEPVRQALAAVHVTRLTVCDVQEILAPAGHPAPDDPVTPAALSRCVMMEIAVNEDFVDRTVRTIAAALALPGGDGPPTAAERVFVLPMQEAVQIYRDVRGPEAL